MTQPITEATPRAARIRSLIKRAGILEKTMYASIVRAVLRRPAIRNAGVGFSYKSPVLTILWIFIGLSAVELIIVDMIVNRWLIVRIAFLVISIWGLIWMLGLLCSYYMRPHVVSPEGIDIRDGMDLDLYIPWSSIHSVGILQQSYDPKPPKVLQEDEKTLVIIQILNQTNIEITLDEARPITLPGIHPKGGEHAVSVVRIWVDDPRAYLDEVRKHL